MEFNKMIKEICDKNNIKCTFLSKNWVIKLEKDDMTRYITGNKFDLNGHALGNIMDDNLINIGKDTEWLLHELKCKGKKVHDILLATVDINDKLILYERLPYVDSNKILE